jgi:hypothetical protein
VSARVRPTPTGLDHYQVRAFLEAAEAWESQHVTGEVTAPWLTRTADDPRALDLPEPGDDHTYWVSHETALRRARTPKVEKPRELWVRPRNPKTGHLQRGPAPGNAKTEKPSGSLGTCGTVITKGSWAGRLCPRIAGQGTNHVGAGKCLVHGGAKRHGRAYGAWLMAHAFGVELNITPWEALLKAVRIAAGKVAYCEWVIGQANSDLELEGRVTRTGEGEEALLIHPDTGEPLGVGQFRDLSFWVRQSELWHDRMAKTAKMAIDAGVAKWEIEKAEQDAAAIASVLNAVVDGLSEVVDETTLLKVRGIMRQQLMAMDDQSGRRQLVGVGDPNAGVVDSTYHDNQ